MKTNIIEQLMARPAGEEARSIIQSCVHCGFCNATCPTYQELGDERDGPRGRIYLMKQYLEGVSAGFKSRLHLDRCLSCRSCETTCPSGVKYGRLLDITRGIMEEQLPRPMHNRFLRWSLRQILPQASRFSFLLKLGQFFRPVLPQVLAIKIPPRQIISSRPTKIHKRRMLVLEGCIQSSATPNTNNAAARVLDKLGIQLVSIDTAGCCGAVNYHLGNHIDGLNDMRRNIDAWWASIEAGVEAILVTASGCGTSLQDYAHLLRHDIDYSETAKRVSELFVDLSRVFANEDLTALNLRRPAEKIAIHIPCTLQHALGQTSTVREIFRKLDYRLAETEEDHLCCGSAGTYSLLEPKLSKQLKKRKIKSLTGDSPDIIATANIGCQLHIQSGTQMPVQHWIELLDQ
jgi:glycolate oxidase iron-sulfur subunit